MPSKQAARRAAAKARSNASDPVAIPSDSVKGACKGQPSDTIPELRCECCAAGGCAHAAQQSIYCLRARFGHAIQVVANPGEDEAFMYTVGADPEFFVEDVPKECLQEMRQTMNLLVDRVKSGHPVQHGHTISAIGVNGVASFVAVQLQGVELCQALASKCLFCDRDAQVVQLQPVAPQCDRCIRSGNAHEDASGKGYI